MALSCFENLRCHSPNTQRTTKLLRKSWRRFVMGIYFNDAFGAAHGPMRPLPASHEIVNSRPRSAHGEELATGPLSKTGALRANPVAAQSFRQDSPYRALIDRKVYRLLIGVAILPFLNGSFTVGKSLVETTTGQRQSQAALRTIKVELCCN